MLRMQVSYLRHNQCAKFHDNNLVLSLAIDYVNLHH